MNPDEPDAQVGSVSSVFLTVSQKSVAGFVPSILS